MPKITSSFTSGLNQDRGFSKGDNKSLFSALDIDIITNIGESTGIIANSKGNQLSFEVPNVQAVYTIELDGSLGSPSVVINGIGPLVLSIVATTTIQDVYNEIVASYAAYIAAGDYGVYYNNYQVYIVGFNSPLVVATGGAGITSSLVVSAQSNLSIIGWGLLDEEIILITTSNTNITTTPTNTVGQVWRVPYDDATNTINNLAGTSLDPQYHLVYNNILNLSLAWEVIRELIGRVESSTKGSIYWLDDYNTPRALNIYNSQSLAIPPGLLGWKPEINTSTPIINGILNGGNTKVGSYQFSYQLYSADGAISQYSPLSTLIPITDDSFSATPYYQFDGAEVGTNAGKSIRVKIPYIDRRYDYIKIAVVFYELENLPNIYTFIDQPITDDVMEFLYTGNENLVSIKLEDFLNPQISFDVAKTLTQKKNRLYVGNTSTQKFDLDWDARAYRFSDGVTGTTELGVAVPVGSTYLYSRNGTGTQYTLAGLTGIADTLDLVNSYNDESGQVYGLFPANDYDTTAVNWKDNFQFKYQSDGVTIGGEGPNVSYTFNVKTYTGDQDVTAIPKVSPFVNVTTENVGGSTQAIYSPVITELEPTIDGWDSIKNPFYSMTFPSHARGEVYRYSLTAYNTKGQQSFAKWIADIKIPEPWEDNTFDLSSLNGNAQELRAIYITFTIDTSSLPADITGFRILRCPRTDDDKTRLGVGLTTGLCRYKVKYATDPAAPQPAGTNSWLLAMKTDTNGVITQTESTLEINFNFAPIVDPGVNKIYGSANNGADPVTLGVIKFPDFDFDKYQIGQASHIKKLHRYDITNTTIDGDQNPGGIPVGNMYWSWDYGLGVTYGQAFLHKLNTVTARDYVINDIAFQTGVGIDGQILNTFSASMGGYDYNNVTTFGFYNGGTGNYDDNEVCGLGSKFLFVDYSDDMDYSGLGVQEYSIVSLCRFNQGAYGGPWRASRYNNVYQAASDFLPIEAYNSTSQSLDVYGGDVYLSYYTTPYCFFHWGETYGVAEATPSGLAGNYYPLASTQLALAHAFPVECSINTELRYGSYFNKNQVNQFEAGAPDVTINQSAVFARFLSDDFLFNDAMAQENNLLKYVPKPFLASDDEENRTRVWYSNEKFDREIIDSWRLFGVNNYKDLEGMYGELNKLSNLNEILYGHQSRAIARISSEELTTVPNGEGATFQAGTGQLLARYDYISKETGAFHQHSVVTTPSSIYHYDIRLNKLYKLSQGLEPLTDIKGLSAFFRANTEGDIRTDDQILLGKGVHGVYDTMFNKAYFTFLKTTPFTYTTKTINANNDTVFTGFPEEIFELYIAGQTINIGGTGYTILEITEDELIIDGIYTRNSGALTLYLGFTIAYNEILGGFESFYSFHPRIYLGTGKRLFSANPYDEQNSVYQHNIGNFGEFYDKAPSTSMIQFIVNYPDLTKLPTFRYDVLEFWSEVTDNLNQDYPLESITGVVLSNDYQTTGDSLTPLTLGPQGNFESVRNERTWRINRVFDYTNPAMNLKPYLRDKYTRVTMYYDNSLNRYLRLHDINSNITLSYNV